MPETAAELCAGVRPRRSRGRGNGGVSAKHFPAGRWNMARTVRRGRKTPRSWRMSARTAGCCAAATPVRSSAHAVLCAPADPGHRRSPDRVSPAPGSPGESWTRGRTAADQSLRVECHARHVYCSTRGRPPRRIVTTRPSDPGISALRRDYAGTAARQAPSCRSPAAGRVGSMRS